jgi:hypothetical protein
VQQAQLAQERPLSIRELKDLSSDPGPCITVLLPLRHEDTRQIRTAAKSAIRAVEQRLEQRNEDRKQVEALMQPLRALPIEIEAEPEQKGVVILRSPTLFERFFVPREIEESVTVARHFNLLPLIPVLRENEPFYILALSQKHVRLLRCTNTTSEEVNLPRSVPHNLDDFLLTDRPDHALDNASAGGPGTGSMERVTFGTGSDNERKDEHLSHFYRTVDRGITELLQADNAPLVIAGVEYELPLYRSVSQFPRLVDEAVRGAPDGLKGGELHKRALGVVAAHRQKDVERALAMYEQFGGSNRVSVGLKEIVKAAYDGRVMHLFVAQGAHYMGNFDDLTHKVHAHRSEQPGDDDLVNAAAVETLRHAGDIFVIPTGKVPHGSQMAAVMRY